MAAFTASSFYRNAMSSKFDLSPSFAFLAQHEFQLAALPSLAEHQFHVDHNTCLLKLRQFGERLAQRLLAVERIAPIPGERQIDLLHRLERAGVIEGDVADSFHRIRKIGNDATHSFLGKKLDAGTCLAEAHYLAIWFHRRSGRPSFTTPPYKTPAPPVDKTEGLRARIAELEAQVIAANEEMTREAGMRAKANEERDVALTLAAEVEAQLSRSPALPKVVDFNRPMVWVEQKHHLDHFVGRDDQMQKLLQQFQESDSSYTLVVGAPGTGKSAFLSKVADSMARGATNMPVLLHLSKGGGDERQILRFLLWQASRHLDSPLPERVYRAGLLDLRDLFVESLTTLGHRSGRVLVVIDGLDEVVRDLDQPARDLVFLPDHLPRGTHVLLASRPLEPIHSHLERRISALNLVSLRPLNTQEILAIMRSRVDTDTFEWLHETGALADIEQRTRGIPLLLDRVAAKASEVRTQHCDRGHDNAPHWVPSSLDALFADHYREVCSPQTGRARSQGLRRALIDLLATASEPIGAEELRRALAYSGKRVELRTVKRALTDIGGVLVSLGGYAHRLYHEGFAEYVRALGGLEAQAQLHRALAGPALSGQEQVQARMVPHLAHLTGWYRCARDVGHEHLAQRALAAAADSFIQLDVLQAVLATGQLDDLAEGLTTLTTLIGTQTREQQASRLRQLSQFLNANLAELTERPWILPQQLMRCDESLIPEEQLDANRGSHASFRLKWSSAPSRDTTTIRTFSDATSDGGVQLNGVQSARHAPVFVASTADSEILGAWRRDTGEQLWRRRIDHSWPPASGFCTSDQGLLVAAATSVYRYPPDDEFEDAIGTDGGILLFDGRTGDQIWELSPQFDGGIAGLAFSHDENTLYAVSGFAGLFSHAEESVMAHAIDVRTGRVISSSPPAHDLARIECVQLTADGTRLVCGGLGKTDAAAPSGVGAVASWDVSALEDGCTVWRTGKASITCVNVDHAGKLVAASSAGEVGVGTLRARSAHWTQTQLPSIQRLCMLPGGDAILGGREDYLDSIHVILWRPATASAASEVHDLGSGVTTFDAGWSDGEWLVATDGGIRLAETSWLQSWQEGISTTVMPFVAHSPDLRLAAVKVDSDHIQLRNTATGSARSGAIKIFGQLQTERGHILLRSRWTLSATFVSIANDGTMVIVDDILRGVAMRLVIVTGSTGAITEEYLLGPALRRISISADGSTAMFVVQPKPRTLSPEVRKQLPAFQRALESHHRQRKAVRPHRSVDSGVPVASVPVDTTQTPQTEGSVSALSSVIHQLREPRILVIRTEDLTVKMDEPFDDTRHAGTGIGLSDDGQYLAILCKSYSLRIVNTESVNVRLLLEASDSERRSVTELLLNSKPPDELPDLSELYTSFAPESFTFCGTSDEVFVSGTGAKYWKFTRRWNLATGDELQSTPMQAIGSLSIDGRIVFCRSPSGVSAFELSTGKEIAFWPRLAVTALAIRDEGRLALRTADGVIEVLELCESR